jgi:hypothetical protein
MKKTSISSLSILILGLTILSACGGGSSSSAPQPSGPTTAVIKIQTTGILGSGTLISGITVTGVLPAGVSVKATPDAQNPSVLVTNPGVVLVSGVTGSNAQAPINTFNPTDRTLGINVVDQDGFGIGEFVTVHCDIASGTTTTAGGFGITDFVYKDLNGALISGLTPTFTVDIH